MKVLFWTCLLLGLVLVQGQKTCKELHYAVKDCIDKDWNDGNEEFCKEYFGTKSPSEEEQKMAFERVGQECEKESSNKSIDVKRTERRKAMERKRLAMERTRKRQRNEARNKSTRGGQRQREENRRRAQLKSISGQTKRLRESLNLLVQCKNQNDRSPTEDSPCGKATQKGVVRAGSNGQVDDQQIELYEKRLQNSINDLTRKSIEIRSRGRSRGGNSNRTPEQKRQEIVRSTLLLQRKLKQCKAEPGKDCVIDGHKYSQDEVEATEAKVKSVIQRQRDAVRKKKDEAFRRQREERERRRET